MTSVRRQTFPWLSLTMIHLCDLTGRDIQKLTELIKTGLKVNKRLYDLFDGSEDEMICLRGRPISLRKPPYSGKYFIWRDQWPSIYDIPSYCNGQCQACTGHTAKEIYKTASTTSRHDFRVEDLFYTGIIRKKAGLARPKSLDEAHWKERNTKETMCLHFPGIQYEGETQIYKNN